MAGPRARMHWPLPDPACDAPDASATDAATRFRAVRDELRRRLWSFARTNLDDGLSLGAPGNGELAAVKRAVELLRPSSGR